MEADAGTRETDHSPARRRDQSIERNPQLGSRQRRPRRHPAQHRARRSRVLQADRVHPERNVVLQSQHAVGALVVGQRGQPATRRQAAPQQRHAGRHPPATAPPGHAIDILRRRNRIEANGGPPRRPRGRGAPVPAGSHGLGETQGEPTRCEEGVALDARQPDPVQLRPAGVDFADALAALEVALDIRERGEEGRREQSHGGSEVLAERPGGDTEVVPEEEELRGRQQLGLGAQDWGLVQVVVQRRGDSRTQGRFIAAKCQLRFDFSVAWRVGGGFVGLSVETLNTHVCPQ